MPHVHVFSYFTIACLMASICCAGELPPHMAKWDFATRIKGILGEKARIVPGEGLVCSGGSWQAAAESLHYFRTGLEHHVSAGRVASREKVGAMHLTFHLRFKADSQSLEEASLVTIRLPEPPGGKPGLDRAGVHLAVMKFNTIRLLAAMIDMGGKWDGRFVAMPLWELENFQQSGWHDMVVRISGMTSELFVDGVLRDRRNVAAIYAQEHQFFIDPPQNKTTAASATFGADPDGRRPFQGTIASFTSWPVALEDERVRDLSGGRFDPRWTKPLGWNTPATFPASMTPAQQTGWLTQQMRAAHERMLAEDVQAPHSHVMVPGESYNHTAFFHAGRHHLFPINNWGWWGTLNLGDTCAWAHYSTSDLVHWQLHPLLPKPVTAPANGCLVEHDGIVHALTGWGPRRWNDVKHRGLNYLTASDASLLDWVEPDNSPLAMPDPEKYHGEDCDVFRHGGEYCLLASSAKNAGNEHRRQMLLYRSNDLRSWRYSGVFYEVEGESAPECVHIFEIGGKYVLTGAQRMRRDTQYLVGRIENDRFIPETRGLWTHNAGDGFPTAAWTTLDPAGRRILWQWLQGATTAGTPVRERMAAGWASGYTLPQLINLKPDGTLGFTPVPELAGLRVGPGEALKNETLDAAHPHPFKLLGNHQELRVKLSVAKGGTSGLALISGKERVELRYESATQELVLDLLKTVHGASIAPKLSRLQLPLAKDEPLDLRVFVDGCIIEIYANGGRFAHLRWYAPEPHTLHAEVFTQRGTVELLEAAAWPLRSVWQ